MCLVDDFKEATKDTNGEFGHNCEFNFLHHFKKLEKMGATIKIKSYDEIDLSLPVDDDTEAFDDMLIYILTKLPGCSSALYNRRQCRLSLNWHF